MTTKCINQGSRNQERILAKQKLRDMVVSEDIADKLHRSYINEYDQQSLLSRNSHKSSKSEQDSPEKCSKRDNNDVLNKRIEQIIGSYSDVKQVNLAKMQGISYSSPNSRKDKDYKDKRKNPGSSSDKTDRSSTSKLDKSKSDRSSLDLRNKINKRRSCPDARQQVTHKDLKERVRTNASSAADQHHRASNERSKSSNSSESFLEFTKLPSSKAVVEKLKHKAEDTESEDEQREVSRKRKQLKSEAERLRRSHVTKDERRRTSESRSVSSDRGSVPRDHAKPNRKRPLWSGVESDSDCSVSSNPRSAGGVTLSDVTKLALIFDLMKPLAGDMSPISYRPPPRPTKTSAKTCSRKIKDSDGDDSDEEFDIRKFKEELENDGRLPSSPIGGEESDPDEMFDSDRSDIESETDFKLCKSTLEPPPSSITKLEDISTIDISSSTDHIISLDHMSEAMLSEPVGAKSMHVSAISESMKVVKPESVRTEAVKTGAVKTEAVKTEDVRPEAVRTETVKTEAVKAEAVRSEAVKSEAVKPASCVNPSTSIVHNSRPEDCSSTADFVLDKREVKPVVAVNPRVKPASCPSGIKEPETMEELLAQIHDGTYHDNSPVDIRKLLSQGAPFNLLLSFGFEKLKTKNISNTGLVKAIKTQRKLRGESESSELSSSDERGEKPREKPSCKVPGIPRTDSIKVKQEKESDNTPHRLSPRHSPRTGSESHRDEYHNYQRKRRRLTHDPPPDYEQFSHPYPPYPAIAVPSYAYLQIQPTVPMGMNLMPPSRKQSTFTSHVEEDKEKTKVENALKGLLKFEQYQERAYVLKKEADPMVNQTDKIRKYLESCIQYVYAALSLNQPKDKPQAYSFLHDTVRIVDYCLQPRSRRGLDVRLQDKRLAVLCLLLVSAIRRQMWLMRKQEFEQLQERCQAFCRNQVKQKEEQGRQNNTPSSTKTLNQSSPTPSPAGSIVSMASYTGTEVLDNGGAGGGISSPYEPVPQRMMADTYRYFKLAQHLYDWSEYWAEANKLAQESLGFFNYLDEHCRIIKPCTHIYMVACYVEQGLLNLDRKST